MASHRLDRLLGGACRPERLRHNTNPGSRSLVQLGNRPLVGGFGWIVFDPVEGTRRECSGRPGFVPDGWFEVDGSPGRPGGGHPPGTRSRSSAIATRLRVRSNPSGSSGCKSRRSPIRRTIPPKGGALNRIDRPDRRDESDCPTPIRKSPTAPQQARPGRWRTLPQPENPGRSQWKALPAESAPSLSDAAGSRGLSRRVRDDPSRLAARPRFSRAID